MTNKQTNRAILMVLDGFGIANPSPSNAVLNAKMPFYRSLLAKYPHSRLTTHGEAVGLPHGVMGNSEVGHMTLGAGRIIYQDLMLVSKSIENRSFFQNKVLRNTIIEGSKKTGRVHLMGLLSDGGVHSHIDHLLALLDLCTQLSVPHVSVHAFLDGRDTPPDSSPGYFETLLKHPAFSDTSSKTTAIIATLMGRYWAMDRDKRWDRVQRAFDTLTGRVESHEDLNPIAAVKKSYSAGKTDEFVEPVLLKSSGAIQPGDSVIFFNFRADRARELTSALTKQIPEITNSCPGLSAFAGMTVYDVKFNLPAAFGHLEHKNIFPKALENLGLKQLRIAETEKYAHVTFFFNGGQEKAHIGEDRLLIPSPKEVPTYDLKPEMSAAAVAQNASEKISIGIYDFILLNFANPDMVGHTGIYPAVIKALEFLDGCIKQVIETALKQGYHILLTADHGNAEEMTDAEGKPHTQHTLNPVQLIWISPEEANTEMKNGTLADIAPTLCTIMNITQPSEMTGHTLLA